MKTGLLVAACGIAAFARVSLAQVPDDIAQKVRAAGQAMDDHVAEAPKQQAQHAGQHHEERRR